MSAFTVTLSVPEELAAGLADRRLERIGGVVRDRVTKQTIAWLRDTGMDPNSGTNELPTPSRQMMDALGLPVQALATLQVANLAVSAAGFALVLQKLGELDRKLDEVLGRLASIGEDVRWIRGVLDADLLSRLHAAARKLSLPVFEQATVRLAILGDLVDIGELLDGRRSLLLSQGTALVRSDVFDLYSRYLAHCIQLQLSTCWSLEPGTSSARLARDWNFRLARSAEQLSAPVTNGLSDMDALRTFATLSSKQRDGARRAHEALIGSALAAEQQADQLELLAEAGVSAGDLELVDRTHPQQLVLLQLGPDTRLN